jgi:adenylate cyclase
VLPFVDFTRGNLSEDRLADVITDDLTNELSTIGGAVVIARETAYAYKRKEVTARGAGLDLGVRYVVEGSVHGDGKRLGVNVQVVSTETGSILWSDRFDEDVSALPDGQQPFVAGIRYKLGNAVVEIETARSLRERPNNPDAFDLILRARALDHLPPSQQRAKEEMALYERALYLDPSSISAMNGVAYLLVDANSAAGWGTYGDMQRAAQLLKRSRAIAPASTRVLNTLVYWLRTVDRCPEAIEAAEQAIRLDASKTRMWAGIYNELAVCKRQGGHAEDEIALQREALKYAPLSPYAYSRYRHIGIASLLLGRDADAIESLQQSLAANSNVYSGLDRTYRALVVAYARSGQMKMAKHYLSEADRLFPFETVRSLSPGYPFNPIYAQQIRNVQAGLRLAGERDHADENADFGLPADDVLHSEVAAHTPTSTPGVKPIRTADLSQFIIDAHPLIIDTVSNSWGRSLPGAVGLRFVGLGGSTSDAAQAHLRAKMTELTSGKLDKPIVAIGWNSERFDGRNLALRLAALGFTNVYWYRGGREAWEVAGLPEEELDVQTW